MKILVLNAGSSSLKSCLYDINGETLPDHPPVPLWEAGIDRLDQHGVADLRVITAYGDTYRKRLQIGSPGEATTYVLKTMWSGSTQVIKQPGEIDIVGHRVVHGGREYRRSTMIDSKVKAAISRLATLAPAHNPANLAGIEAIEQVLGDVPQVAVFDTAFHSDIPDAAAVYPGPYEWVEQGIRRYGFHGISHQYCAGRAAQILGRDLESLRLITCHLGNGCSLAAVRNGQCIDTTMGFTPLEGLMMGSRSGSIDPGILLYLMREKGYTTDQIDEMLHKNSGLKGISGLSGDMREIAAAMAAGNPRAQLAFDIYVHRIRFHIGAMTTSLGGLDALVFTAGIGENSISVRSAVCEGFEFLNLQLDPGKNENRPIDQDVAGDESAIRVLVVHTQEDWAIARECWKFAGQVGHQ
jgi:acetate kinase